MLCNGLGCSAIHWNSVKKWETATKWTETGDGTKWSWDGEQCFQMGERFDNMVTKEAQNTIKLDHVARKLEQNTRKWEDMG